MVNEPDLDRMITQLGLGWTKFSKRATGFLKVVITHASSGDESKTLASLSGFYEAMDFGKIPGDRAHLFIAACDVLVSKRLLPQDLLPLGAFRGSETEGSRYLVLTSIGLATQDDVRLYTAKTRFTITQRADTPGPKPNGPTGLLSAAARPNPTTTADINVSDPGWQMDALLEGSKIDYAKRMCAKLTAIVEQTWSADSGTTKLGFSGD